MTGAIIILKSTVSRYSFKTACLLAVKNIFLKQRNASFVARDKNGKCREKAGKYRQDSTLGIGHHDVKVLRKLKQSGKKWEKVQSFANKNRRYQLKNFKSMNPIRRQRILRPSFHKQKKTLGLTT